MARFERRTAEQERPYPAAESGKDRTYKAGWAESERSWEGVRGAHST